MRLRSLEIQGFKSFPDKTKIEFDEGMTVVVGPNGSGKSNISDAIRWVLGEQSTKALRGGKMEDVIFAGTAARKPLGMATVSLTFDNFDRTLPVESDEVAITRRYFRSGESEYLVNGKPVRLRDLSEMLMDTGLGRDGYSMIGQGRIAEIISAKSRERREIFEEAAGIAKYRFRREEAERKLEQAQENLLRLYDILSELEGRVGPLKEQAEKAERFLALSEEKKKLEISLWLLQLQKLREDLKEQENRCLIARGEDERLKNEADRLEQQIQEAYDQTRDCLTKSEEYRQIRENLQNRIAAGKSEIAVHENERTHALLEQKRLRDELAGGEAAEKAGAAAIFEARKKLQTLREKLQELERQEQEAKAQAEAVADAGKSAGDEAAALQSQLAQCTLDISRFTMAITAASRSEADERDRQAADKEALREAEGKLAAETGSRAELNGLLDEIRGKRETLQNTLSGYQLKLQSRREAADQIHRQVQDLELEEKGKLQRASLLRDLESHMEGFNHSVKTVMGWKQRGQMDGVHGTVAGLIEVPENYAVAIETALGAGLQNIVVENEETAKACIRRLQRERAGRATFLPLTAVRGNLLNEPGLIHEPGFVGIASELVGVSDRYKGAVRFLLGRIAVASDLDTAADIAKKYRYKFRIVTLDGQQINAGGSFTGGSAARSQGILSRRGEAEALKREADAIRARKEAASRKEAAARQELQTLTQRLEEVREELMAVSEDLVRFEGELGRAKDEIESAAARKAALSAQIREGDEKLSALETERMENEAALKTAELKKAELEAKLKARQGSQDELSGKLDEMTARLNQLSIEKIVLQKDTETAETNLQSVLDARQAAREKREETEKAAAALEEKVKTLEADIQSGREQVEAFTRQVAEYGEKNEAMLKRRTQLEGETLSLRQQSRELSARKERAAGESARLQEQKTAIQRDYDQLVARMWEEYELTPREAAELKTELASASEGNRQLGILKNQIKALGSINVSAIEEYKEVSERYRFLKRQVDDAASARDELLGLIDQLTGEMKELFGSAFHEINRHFGEIFRELFGGGKASLQLDDPSDILECGIEILVQPPGKIIKNLAALSGGEQALVAVAIYFAILKVRPSPFCVLDEIEAALDDVNVARYAAYLKGISDKTQFILITHRRGTMEEADTLYGVTMQESGVSKLLQLKVSQLEKEKAPAGLLGEG